MQPDFGQPISIAESNKLFFDLHEIKKRTKAKLEEALQGDEEALRYYLGDEVAFVFGKEAVLGLVKIIESYGHDSGVLFYRGTRFDKKAQKGGRPTLMAFAYNTFDAGKPTERISIITRDSGLEIMYSEELKIFTTAEASAPIPAGQRDGEEHPGGGRGGFATGVIPTSFIDVEPFT